METSNKFIASSSFFQIMKATVGMVKNLEVYATSLNMVITAHIRHPRLIQ